MSKRKEPTKSDINQNSEHLKKRAKMHFVNEEQKNKLYAEIQQRFNIEQNVIEKMQEIYKGRAISSETILQDLLLNYFLCKEDITNFKAVTRELELNSSTLASLIDKIPQIGETKIASFFNTKIPNESKKTFIDFLNNEITRAKYNELSKHDKIDQIEIYVIDNDLESIRKLIRAEAIDVNNIYSSKQSHHNFKLDKEISHETIYSLLHIAAAHGGIAQIEQIQSEFFSENINIGEGEHTPLHEALKYGSFAAVKRLLELGANPLSRNYLNETILHLLIQEDEPNVEMIDFLCKNYFAGKLDELESNDMYPSPIDKAYNQIFWNTGNSKPYFKLIEHGATPNHFEIFASIMHNEFEFIETFLKTGHANLINLPDENGIPTFFNLIHSKAGEAQYDPIEIYIRHSVDKTFQLLYDNGLNILASDKNGNNFMHYLSKNQIVAENNDVDSEKILKSIMSHYKNHLDVTNFKGQTALEIAFSQNNEIMTRNLIEMGASTDCLKDPKFLSDKLKANKIPKTLKYCLENGHIKISDKMFKNDEFLSSKPENLSIILKHAKFDNAKDVLNKLLAFNNIGLRDLERSKQLYENGANFLFSHNRIFLESFNPEYRKYVEEKICTELILNPNHPSRNRFNDLLKEFTKNNPEKVKEINELKDDETYIILSKILNNHASCVKLAKLLELNNPKNAAPLNNFSQKIAMSESENNRGIKEDFKNLYKNYVLNTSKPKSLAEEEIGRLISGFKLQYGYRPIANFSSQQLTLATNWSNFIHKRIEENDTQLNGRVEQALEKTPTSDSSLKLLIAAALCRPKETLAENQAMFNIGIIR